LLDFSQGALAAEEALHESFFKHYHVVPLAAEQAPACFAYTQYLLNMAANAGPLIAIAALLPCFWVYQKIGEHISKNQVNPNPYQAWIAMYSSEDFAQSTKKMAELFDYYAAEKNAYGHELAKKAFSRSMYLEYCFWEGSYRMLHWYDIINQRQ
jgi:thiaminase/transcriptional activator TenA